SSKRVDLALLFGDLLPEPLARRGDLVEGPALLRELLLDVNPRGMLYLVADLWPEILQLLGDAGVAPQRVDDLWSEPADQRRVLAERLSPPEAIEMKLRVRTRGLLGEDRSSLFDLPLG